MGIGLDDSPDEYILAYMPITQNQAINGAITLDIF
jgi:hypothetical protein